MDAQKKSLRAREQNPAQRAAFQTQLLSQTAEAFVIVDECGSNLDLTPLYARAPRGQRVVGQVPRNTPANTSIIAALTLQGIGPTLLVPGATDGLAFETYVSDLLVPSLQPGQIVVMDRLSAHRRPQIAQLIATRGCWLWFLPSYSPDLSPIEKAFAKLKTALRRAGARTQEALYDAIRQALPTISAEDARGFFRACGFILPAPRATS